ncbi:MAG: hypothetical protein ACJAVX_000409 [Pseudoalteromonas rhizosphaerae]|jgi:hypothetical protein|uniref:Fis family transcriptional regulator n=1 Tax=Pseudoalteromonas neustonica TaxID=1840331 RepID=A0ABY3FCG4_9GAMM|nr:MULTISPECIES: hypothetical protein [Pseudoalteromonas]MBB1292131.1 hypothetical protein [Pseudoalteromonas sp. SR41-4]MBB1300955.1 hypothetical protein [Pseudoalteromonas sp. SR44-8]MBB1311077.1 hypothetical protein [Pseudoalteromonas sp. SR41-8]MBB1408888.1 hypothetical protein [Pseudoalteromonas sp. SG44-17]MBB1505804.1 hypothetical protein [Pseudoalteromonas sp. SG41-1]|tara:strand:- start:8260 stop:8541 length:282 start_codon:yes stop_codon:yes gene_type:complete
MTKTQKQLDKLLRATLTGACEQIKDHLTDFSWLTHHIDLKKPATSLKVRCYFIDALALEQAKQKQQLALVESIIVTELAVINLTPQEVLFLAD